MTTQDVVQGTGSLGEACAIDWTVMPDLQDEYCDSMQHIE